MTPRRPAVTIVVPTHNRRHLLPRTVGSLAGLDDAEKVELIVVADGCRDDSVTWLQAQTWPFPLAVIETPGLGAAAARNAGAARARGEVLLFLDDDVIADPFLVAAHRAALDGGGERVSLGYLPPLPTHRSARFRALLAHWWRLMFDRMARPGYRFGYRDLLTGNVALPRALFERVGRFNADLRCHEDYELGYRLILAGARFAFTRAAWGWHLETSDPRAALRRKIQEGIAEVQFIRLHPELFRSLELFRLQDYLSTRVRGLRGLAFRDARRGAIDVRDRHVMLLTRLDRARQGALWGFALDTLLIYYFWLGVARGVGSIEALDALCSDALTRSQPPLLHRLDLAKPWAEIEAELAHFGPVGVDLWFGDTWLGKLPGRYGAEGVDGTHVAAWLDRAGADIEWEQLERRLEETGLWAARPTAAD